MIATGGYDGGRTKGWDVNDLIDTTEMYLRTIYELEEEGVVPLRARIAERLAPVSYTHLTLPTIYSV